MRMSRTITLTVLSGLVLTACLATGGCRRRPADRTWYDAHGHATPERYTTGPDGKQVPDPHPHDRYGRPWVYDAAGVLVPLPPPYRASSWFWGGSGYRSGGSSTSYRSGSPSVSSPSVGRGGFGSTGAGTSGGG